MRFDAAVVGGGLIGAACAYRLAREGLSVALFEARAFAREASWAGAGLLAPIHPWRYPAPLQPLLRAAAPLHAPLAAELLERTGIDVELRECGMVVMDREMERLEAWLGPGCSRRVQASAEESRVRVPGEGLLLPQVAVVKSHRLARALIRATLGLGGSLFERTPVTRLLRGGLETGAGPVSCGIAILCMGCWSGRLLEGAQVEPVRGQILLYRGEGRRVVIFPEGEYVVPRSGGFLLFGSTLERAGFDARPTQGACSRLEVRAHELLGLDPSALVAAWAGLRPATPSMLPYLGRVGGRADLIAAFGHYRNGILLAPLTGGIVADLVMGRDPGFSLDAFQPPPPS
ncbi:MAG: NAD(P)/FAD-dependent oxidoreductase [Planctomycetaceae bacterium]